MGEAGDTRDRGHQAGRLSAVIIDWGGVMTNPIVDTVRAWVEAEGIDWDHYIAAMRPWFTQAYDPNGSQNPIHELERGECDPADFEAIFAARLRRLDGAPVPAQGLLRRMFAASAPIPAMYDLVRALRAAGFSTALLSNSWGCFEHEYPRADFPGLFDSVVISGEVGMRKPEQRIFLHAVQTLGLHPAECVFVDDIEANVTSATECGMTGVLHADAATTAAVLESLLNADLGPAPVSMR